MSPNPLAVSAFSALLVAATSSLAQTAQQSAPPASSNIAGPLPSAGAGPTRALQAAQIENMSVTTPGGEEIGEVDDVLVGPGGLLFLVVEHGGVLGIGERRVLMPLAHFSIRDDRRLVAIAFDHGQLRAEPAYDRAATLGYRAVDPDAMVSLPLYNLGRSGAASPVGVGAPGAAMVGTAPASGPVNPTGVGAAGADGRPGYVPPFSGGPPAEGPVQVSRVLAAALYNARGERLGDVERVVRANDGKVFAVIQHGGLAGGGQAKRIALPVENMSLLGDRLTIRGVTEEQLVATPEFRGDNPGWRELEYNELVTLSTSG